ncbi:hypothetical protein [Nitrospirillum sp. BR 11163]|uniref:hypothetical protein n=1 Tax=Nitrospirillum sp. BR 11163 TaxID=3104323 RepID=UPI002B001690|nr:hypothetical protein [Nitrospirillum sp. BR 11163]MEA1672014.1 hypothetical protein [Nitrospirillum sp. BR 11163]
MTEGIALRPDTLKRTGRGWVVKPLADGADHTFTSASTSAFSPHSFSVWPEQPIFLAIAITVVQRDGRWLGLNAYEEGIIG